MKIQDLHDMLFEANNAGELDLAREIVAEIRKHPDYAGNRPRYVIATRRNQRVEV